MAKTASKEFRFRVRFVMPAKLFSERPAPPVGERAMWGTAHVLEETADRAMEQAISGYHLLGLKVLKVLPA